MRWLSHEAGARVIGLLELSGGISGFWSGVTAMRGWHGTHAGLFLTFVGLGFYAASLVAGLYMLRAKSAGWWLSQWVQGIQVLVFASGSLALNIRSGAAITLGISGSDIVSGVDLGSYFHVKLTGQPVDV